jgi:cell division protein FtsZ
MTITLQAPDIRELKPRITVFGVGGAGGNAVNNMVENQLLGVDFVVANTDAQALTLSKADRRIQLGLHVTEGLGAGSQPEVGRAAAEEVIDEIIDHLRGVNMVFITAGMGGGTGTGAAPVIARAAKEMGILTVGVVTKPFHFEGQRRLRVADQGITDLHKAVDTLIVIPNQNLFRVANERTTFAQAFAMADQVLYSGVSSITDLMTRPFMINLDFADVRAVMQGMGKAMMGTGEATGEKRAIHAAEAAIANPLLDEVSMKGARGLLISVTGGPDMALYEIDEAATRIKEEVDPDANIIFGASEDPTLDGVIRVSVVATGIDNVTAENVSNLAERRVQEVAEKLRQQAEQKKFELPTPPRIASDVRTAPAAATNASAPLFIAAPKAIEDDLIEDEFVSVPPAPVMPAPQPVATVADVTLAPVVKAPQPIPQLLVEEPVAALPMAQPAPAFVPERPETVIRQPRMPSVNELPLPVQDQLRGVQNEQLVQERRGFLDRLSAFGLARRDKTDEPQAVAPVIPAAQPRRPVAPAPAAAAGQHDGNGRVNPQPRTMDDENWDIPTFLRRGNAGK